MKKVLSLATAIIISAAVIAGNGPESYKVNNKVSKIEWTGKKVTGEHTGTISVEEGEIEVTDGKITGGTLYIDMNSIVVTDIKDEEMNGKLKGHLMSPDFFNVAEHPKAKLVITKVEDKGDGKYHIHGELTIKETTEKVEIPATITMEEGKVVAIGETEIDRTVYNIKYGSGKFFDNLGDNMIYDNFTIKFKVGAML